MRTQRDMPPGTIAIRPSPVEGLALHTAFIMCLLRDKCIVPGRTYRDTASTCLSLMATHNDWAATVCLCPAHSFSLPYPPLTCNNCSLQMGHYVMDTYNGKLGARNLEKCAPDSIHCAFYLAPFYLALPYSSLSLSHLAASFCVSCCLSISHHASPPAYLLFSQGCGSSVSRGRGWRHRPRAQHLLCCHEEVPLALFPLAWQLSYLYHPVLCCMPGAILPAPTLILHTPSPSWLLREKA